MTAAYQLRNITQSYNGNIVLALDDFIIESERVTALVGPNGSGKSTLMDMLALIKAPQRGQLEFFSREAANKSFAEIQQQIGYVQQKPFLFNISVEQNIGLGLKLRGIPKKQRYAKIDRVIEEFSLAHLRGRRGNDLSGGEIQRVAIARTLILDPRVLILDEPFSHIDKHFRLELENILRAIRERGEQTVIFSTHDQSQAESLADHILNLQHEDSHPAEILNILYGAFTDNTQVFNTGKMQFHINNNSKKGSCLVIDAAHISLTRPEIPITSKNQFTGRIKNLSEESGQIRVSVDAGELLHAIVSPTEWQALSLTIGNDIRVSCELTAENIIDS